MHRQHPNSTYPSLRQRIFGAKLSLPNSPIVKSPSNATNPVNFLVSPSVAKVIFANHELVKTNDIDSDSDSDYSESSTERPAGSENDYTNASVKKGNGKCPLAYANLRKPAKTTKLLHDSLTNANGETWSRQRYCVSRAFNVDKFLRESCASHAADKTIEIIREAMKKNSVAAFRHFSFKWKKEGRSIRRKGKGLDVRILAREVAIHTMSRVVLGNLHEANDALIDSLRGMVTETLQPKHNEEYNPKTMKKVKKLDAIVRSAIEAVSKDIDIGNEGDCLARRLLFYETKGQPDKYLTRDEVVGNSHSALRAGIQTICTTIAGAISHLAENPQIQTNLKLGNISGKDIVKETLRILPPVAGLPRIPIACDLELENSSAVLNSQNTGNARKCVVAKDQLLVVDLLAFAHSQPSQMNDNQSNLAFNTLKFDPLQKCKTDAQPWGIGRRKCPAGIISVECISEVLEGLAKGGITWSFTDTKDCVGSEYCDGWMDSIYYRPTLCYASPIFVNFRVND